MTVRRLKHWITVAAATLSILFVFTAPAFAATDVFSPACDQYGGSSTGSAACQTKVTNTDSFVGSDGIITKATELIALVTGLAAVLTLIIGGFMYIVAQGDSSKLNTAKSTITYALVGAVVAAIAQGLVTFVISKI